MAYIAPNHIFPKRRRPVRYEDLLERWQAGLLTCGFLWDLARHDEVFAAILRRRDVPKE